MFLLKGEICLASKKTVIESRTIELEGKTYRRLKKEQQFKPYSIEEMMIYDDLFNGD